MLDLELDCVHEIGGQGSWLKVPLGKLDTERMVPLDDETVELIDRVTEIRSPGRPLPHPRTGKPAQFLFTRQGRRLSQNAVRAELDRAAADAGLDHVTPHQLRHTYATALVNAGVSLQSLMALLGHVSAEMSLRYGKLFDATVRTEYERALTLAKDHLAILPTGPTTKNLPLTDITGGGDWKDTPTIKSRLAGGFCLRAPAQGACVYANICEHCPNFRTDTTYPARPGRPTHRHPSPRQRRRTTRLDQRSPTPPPTHRPPRRRHRRNPSRMTRPDILTRVEQACNDLTKNNQHVSYTAVAAIANTARTTLYRNPTLRAVIEQHRHQPTQKMTLTRIAEEITILTTALEALADKVRHQEEQIRRLTRHDTDHSA